jgi:capsular polysaccharide export protein
MAGKFAAVHWLDWGVWSQRHLSHRLGMRLSIATRWTKCSSVIAYVGWGLKRSGQRARLLAARRGRACWLLEDGFLRSLEGSEGASCSLVVDDLGIYYDASSPSRLEVLISTPIDAEQRERARRLVATWKDERLSKYNAGRDPLPEMLPRPYVLIVDQTAGDAAIAAGNATPASFQSMLADAASAYPDCTLVVRIHPEVVSGHKKGHFDVAALQVNPRVRIIADGSHPALWIKHARAVYTVTSQLGFEALLWSIPVYVYGMPFYAGWGLTHDILPAPNRRRASSLEQLVHASLVSYPRYFDPETGRPCQVEELMAWMALQRRQRQRFPSHVSAYGFSKWKQPFVRDFLSGSIPQFLPNLPSPPPRDQILVTWGHKYAEELEKNGYKRNVLRIEDGFLRSVGLGADLIRPISWVVDPDGIHYDARFPSGLENMLNSASFPAALRERAEALRSRIVSAGVTKYNLQLPRRWQRPVETRSVTLVIGQVETDAAIRYGTANIQRNIDLLKAVRHARPNTYILYKPHPDVMAGLRRKGEGESDALQWCDEVVGDVPFEFLLDHVDEVHVLTSLAGFEALLRQVPVVTWGMPFYAGWGLTQDCGMTPAVKARRTRRLQLDELVAGTLILYPTYVSRRTRHFCTPETAVQELLDWRNEPASSSPIRRVIARLTRKP